MNFSAFFSRIATSTAILVLIAGTSCNNQLPKSENTEDEIQYYNVGGSITGLTESGLVLQLNGENVLSVQSGMESFMFPVKFQDGDEYTVSVKSAANNTKSIIENGSGIINGSDVNNIEVTCSCVDYSSLLQLSSSELADVYFSTSAFADVDGDGDLDLFLTGSTDSGNGTFTDSSAGITAVSDGTCAFADVDGDADQDLLVAGRDSDVNDIAILYLNDGNGGFSDGSAGLTVFFYGDLEFADIDGDRDKDLALTGSNASGPLIKLYANNGEGVFTDKPTTSLHPGSGGSLAFSDVDNDNDKDLVITGYTGATTDYLHAYLYLNDGSGNFTMSPVTLTDIVGDSSSAFGDVDNDGDPDLLICGHTPGTFTYSSILYTNHGSGNFAESAAVLTGVYGTSISIADIDSDNDLDIVISGRDSELNASTILYENTLY